MSATSPEIVSPPETDELKKESLALVASAKALRITNHEEYATAGRELVRVARVRKGIVEAFREPKKKAADAHRSICKLENDLLVYPVEAERLLKGAIATFDREERDRIRREELRLQEESRKRNEDRLLEEAIDLEAAGEHQAAEELVAGGAIGQVIELQRPVAEGIQTRRSWTFDIVNPLLVAREFMVPDEKKIRALVKALGPDAAKAIGGIVVREETTVAVSTG